ncbi:hypothetical protein AYO46_08785 [Betaproteobacteria bacterium SCGC AG-212-J23]|nr:hypothetical protein AYO46_08785 [Betaproteobacteria bacterium SCGC AG-212-J23]
MRQRFAEEDVRNVPDEPSIFFLYHESDLVYIGRTPPRSGLRTELEHALRMAMAEDMDVTHFTFELTKSPKTRAAEELREYFENWGRLPQYNRAQGVAFQQRVELRR